jgi:hypothetical protein
MKYIARTLTILLLTAATSLAGSLSMRLVEASNTGSGIEKSLGDVASALKAQLPFSSYKLIASGATTLPANGSRTSLGGYTVTCAGPQTSLTIQITKGRQQLANTTVNLRSGRPLLLGGFPSKSGKLIVVFIAR